MRPAARRRGKAPLTVLRGIAELRQTVARWRRAGQSVGIVPTMGALHAGHLALMRRARDECDRVIATIFVNPKQFNQADDLTGYPREEADDAGKLHALGVDLLFAPPVEEIYPEGFATNVSVAALAHCLCGATRPGHMDGVATVVTKLLWQSLPDKAYFGEKDYQQLLVVRQIARDLDIPVAIVGVATVRETDGLALSSRNVLLTAEQRARAPELYRVLHALAEQLESGAAAGPPLASGREDLVRAGFDPIDYLELRSATTLEALARVDRPARVFAAVWLGQVRLIDNLSVDPGS
ncbi:MAG: pantoate--beta-alanine ligase [Rhodospirillales bacterium]|nr:pantoate--beta-alanine ligase [Rhodospirillales bacterium]MDH3790520.1 pantoate--beta-alanine ligase [Rhodospirillales bacterium]MDH3910808.1 pantoate--beta-alanine ligase [Rhodospirillales bacterium]MDH3918337.1 pantoate--beta-alanine ligase [Rhodospirillales bacterium]MDH3968704.1 pantoate--beta-alanine ligase [Rhodospirillales bacterium]